MSLQFNKLIAYIRGAYILRISIIRKCLKFFSGILANLLYGQFKEISIGSKYPIILNSKFAFSSFELWGEEHNSGFERLIDVSDSKDVVFDIGAHIGLCSLPLSLYTSVKNIIAFEPSENNQKFLKEHIKINNISNIELVPLLIGAKNSDHVNFYETGDVSGIPSIVNLSSLNKSEKVFQISKKHQVCLDYFCKTNNILPDVIKIDVEGAEFDVLEGASKTIVEKNPIIIISLHPKHLKAIGRDIKEIFDYTERFDYELVDCVDARLIEEDDLGLNEFMMRPIIL
jgi:FkbM family methyltransferase